VLLHADIIAAARRLFGIVNARGAVDLIIEDNLANSGCTQNESVWTGWSPERCHWHANQTGDVQEACIDAPEFVQFSEDCGSIVKR
jgi:hypothetical protein